MYKNKHIYSFQQKLSSQITKFGGLGTWLRRRLSMLLKLLTTLMVMICKEAMAGNHSLRSCEVAALVLNSSRFAVFVMESKYQAGRYKLLRKTLLNVLLYD
nr:hypothetical protein CFP56_17108 [Quercus suber]